MASNDSAPPYQRIAHSLRRRIESGRLRPGDRVPSTRAMARKWGVALATAAHALSALGSEGLVRTVPRAGTVVANVAAKAAADSRPARSHPRADRRGGDGNRRRRGPGRGLPARRGLAPRCSSNVALPARRRQGGAAPRDDRFGAGRGRAPRAASFRLARTSSSSRRACTGPSSVAIPGWRGR